MKRYAATGLRDNRPDRVTSNWRAFYMSHRDLPNAARLRNMETGRLMMAVNIPVRDGESPWPSGGASMTICPRLRTRVLTLSPARGEGRVRGDRFTLPSPLSGCASMLRRKVPGALPCAPARRGAANPLPLTGEGVVLKWASCRLAEAPRLIEVVYSAAVALIRNNGHSQCRST